MNRNSGRERPGGNSSEAAKNANHSWLMPDGCFDESGSFALNLVQTAAGASQGRSSRTSIVRNGLHNIRCKPPAASGGTSPLLPAAPKGYIDRV